VTEPRGLGRPARWWETALYRAVRALVHGVALLLGRITVVGRENLPTDTPFVLAPVHRSNVDFALVAIVTKRRMRYMGKDTIFKYKTLAKFFLALGAFPVHRGTADRESLRTCIELIESGQPLVMFPEGTRQTGPRVQELFDGTVYVASKTRVPIVPVGIGGSERVMPKGSKLIRPAKLVLVIGEPIEPPAPTEGGRVSRRSIKEQTARLHDEIQVLFDEAQARTGHPNSLEP
jgi:1-acyl-sn-glycerol-3-phosphate acyltransferase